MPRLITAVRRSALHPTGPRRAGTLVVALGCLALVGACTSDPAPDESTPASPTTVSTSAAPEPTETTTSPAEPEESAEPTAEPSTDASAEPSATASEPSEPEDPSTGPGNAVAALTLRGGMCPDGSECQTVLVVDRDGTWTRTAQGVVEATGEVHEADLEWWSTLGSDLDRDSLVEGKAGGCPRDSDGQEVVLEAVTTDGWVTLESCEVELAPSELLERLATLLEATEL